MWQELSVRGERQERRAEVQWKAKLYWVVTRPLEFTLSKVSERLSKRMKILEVESVNIDNFLVVLLKRVGKWYSSHWNILGQRNVFKDIYMLYVMISWENDAREREQRGSKVIEVKEPGTRRTSSPSIEALIIH